MTVRHSNCYLNTLFNRFSLKNKTAVYSEAEIQMIHDLVIDKCEKVAGIRHDPSM
jgi:hypothetical protein